MAASTTIAPPAPRAGPGDILIYAELLTNLRQITVKASLPTPADQTTKVQILDLGHKFRIEHHGVIRELHLPAQAPIAGALPTSHKGSVDLTWRVPVRPQEAQKRHFVPESQPLPWTAADIQHDTAIACRNCDSCFVEQGKINAWKDLPSENWAEMMEFWHCHKPVDHTKPEDDGLQQRGYGAANTITAQEGVGFVDMTSLLFHESDCQNLLFSSSGERYESSKQALVESAAETFLQLHCSKCAAEVGTFNIISTSVTLFKWQTKCDTTPPQKYPSSSECLVATLISTLSRSGSSKSVIIPRTPVKDESESDNPVLHIWLFNSNVVYTSNKLEGPPTAAIKVLYRSISLDEANKLTESLTGDVQDISFPLAAIQTAQETLGKSRLMLPSSERSFQEWQVGLLERWDPRPD